MPPRSGRPRAPDRALHHGDGPSRPGSAGDLAGRPAGCAAGRCKTRIIFRQQHLPRPGSIISHWPDNRHQDTPAPPRVPVPQPGRQGMRPDGTGQPAARARRPGSPSIPPGRRRGRWCAARPALPVEAHRTAIAARRPHGCSQAWAAAARGGKARAGGISFSRDEGSTYDKTAVQSETEETSGCAREALKTIDPSLHPHRLRVFFGRIFRCTRSISRSSRTRMHTCGCATLDSVRMRPNRQKANEYGHPRTFELCVKGSARPPKGLRAWRSL